MFICSGLTVLTNKQRNPQTNKDSVENIHVALLCLADGKRASE